MRAVRAARRAVVLVALSTLASGCVAPTPPVPGADVDPALLAARRDAALERFDRFRVRGGLGIWNDERSLSARIDWTQRGEDIALGLAAPLGLGAATLRRAGGRATLHRGDAPPLVGSSADVVLQRALGLPVPVPLEQLTLWLRGLPGAARDVERDAEGRLRELRWSDAAGTRWQARVLDYTVLETPAADDVPLAAPAVPAADLRAARAGAPVAAANPVSPVSSSGSPASAPERLELPALLTARGAGYRLRLVLRDWSADIDATVFDEDSGSGVSSATKPSPERPPPPARLPIPTR